MKSRFSYSEETVWGFIFQFRLRNRSFSILKNLHLQLHAWALNAVVLMAKKKSGKKKSKGKTTEKKGKK